MHGCVDAVVNVCKFFFPPSSILPSLKSNISYQYMICRGLRQCMSGVVLLKRKRGTDWPWVSRLYFLNYHFGIFIMY